MKLFARFAAVLLASFGLALPAAATTYSSDYTDLWWNPAESGWGINVIQQGGVIFASMFLYENGQPKWFFASDMRGSPTAFSGTLYSTTGTHYAAPWNPAQFTLNPVGSISLNFSSATAGTLTYTANGATVSKPLRRNAFATNNISGNYMGGMTALASGCSVSAALIMNELTVAQSGNNVSLRVDFTNNQGAASVCTFNGTYAQEGRVGSITGSFSCSGGATNAGSFTMSEVYVNRQGFTSLFNGQDQFCRYNGFFGGSKDVF